MQETIDLNALEQLARKAGAAIMKIYADEDFSQVVDFKADDSPLTLADKASHEVIMAGLTEAYPQIPVISEEGQQYAFEERKGWEYLWLVDPLDGTKEFIKRNGQFTVNIALIHQGRTVLGIVYTPAQDVMYVGRIGDQAYKVDEQGQRHTLKVNGKASERIAVRSRSHAADEEQAVLDAHGVTDSISVGSSLKFCMVAEGKADVYYRHGPTMEWDTAAGQAVVEAAGATMVQGTGTETFVYNRENQLNGSFLVKGF